ncbi:MAG: TetR/AcrR family transcriptional regulator [Bacteroidales bacterium]|jgi:AcrR family transcriptional regulator|nr:TetR/AcrR family transcriptional regulator [Bacteroidales bacterium]
MSGTKEHIVLIASRLFLQKSYKEVTMKELVDKTGMSKGAFYHYFKSKEQVFLESLEFFHEELTRDFSKYSQNSLKKFYIDYLGDTIRLTRHYFKHFENEFNERDITINHFSLVFDALRLFPEYRRKIEEVFKIELKFWVQIIKTARSNGEIKTPLSDVKTGEMFIYLSDGIGINMIMQGVALEDMVKQLKNQWDALYEQIKT